jgi:hypothetical protein
MADDVAAAATAREGRIIEVKERMS